MEIYFIWLYGCINIFSDFSVSLEKDTRQQDKQDSRLTSQWAVSRRSLLSMQDSTLPAAVPSRPMFHAWPPRAVGGVDNFMQVCSIWLLRTSADVRGNCWLAVVSIATQRLAA
jgi:hypothetical protein